MNRITRLFAVTLLAWLVAVPLMAQSVLSSTTLSAAMTDTSSRLMTVASATGFTVPATGATLVYALIDREIVSVRTVNGTIIGIARGQNSTRAQTHVSGAPVWVGPPNAFSSNIPGGQCTRTALTSVPYIVGGGPGLGSEIGTLWDCLGVTTAGQWVNVNGNGGPLVLGSTVASPAGVITMTGTILKVSGTNAITGITVPAGTAAGFTFTVIPTGVFTWTAAGNISLAGTAVVNKALTFTWDGAKWQPSYIA